MDGLNSALAYIAEQFDPPPDSPAINREVRHLIVEQVIEEANASR